MEVCTSVGRFSIPELEFSVLNRECIGGHPVQELLNALI